PRAAPPRPPRRKEMTPRLLVPDAVAAEDVRPAVVAVADLRDPPSGLTQATNEGEGRKKPIAVLARKRPPGMLGHRVCRQEHFDDQALIRDTRLEAPTVRVNLRIDLPRQSVFG